MCICIYARNPRVIFYISDKCSPFSRRIVHSAKKKFRSTIFRDFNQLFRFLR